MQTAISQLQPQKGPGNAARWGPAIEPTPGDPTTGTPEAAANFSPRAPAPMPALVSPDDESRLCVPPVTAP